MEDDFEKQQTCQCKDLKAEISQLKRVIKNYENDRELAANYGAKLLDINQQLREEIEEQRSAFSDETTDLDHKNGLLLNQIKSLKLAIDEADGHRTLQERKHVAKVGEIEQDFEKQLKAINREKDLLQQENREQQLKLSQMKDQNDLLSNELEERISMANNKHVSNSSIDDFEKCELQTQISELTDTNFKLEKANKELGHERDRYLDNLKTMREQISNLSADLEASQCQGSGWYNHLQKTRDELLETKAKLDLANSELNSVGFSKRGNSLFSEIEDKRQLLQAKYTALERKHLALVKSHSFLHEQLGDMKQEMILILQHGNGKAEREKIASLEEALAISRGEADAYALKLKKLQDTRIKNDEFISRKIESYAKAEEGHPSELIIEFLRKQLEDSKLENEKLRKELDVTCLSRIAQDEKLAETEEKLFALSKKSESQKCHGIKLKLKIDSLKESLEKAKKMAGQVKTEEKTASANTSRAEQQKSLASNLPRSIARMHAKQEGLALAKVKTSDIGQMHLTSEQPSQVKDESLRESVETVMDGKKQNLTINEKEELQVSYLDNSWKQPDISMTQLPKQTTIVDKKPLQDSDDETRTPRKRVVTFSDSVSEIDNTSPNKENIAEEDNVLIDLEPRKPKSKMAKTVMVTKESKARQQQQCAQQ